MSQRGTSHPKEVQLGTSMTKSFIRGDSVRLNDLREDGQKRSESKLGLLTPRQRGFVVGKLEGKSDRQAALDAGYAPSTAENTKQKIMSRPEVRSEERRV